MPPALVAELEDVAVQLARLCGELGVGGDEEGDGEEDLDDIELQLLASDDDEFVEDTDEEEVDGDGQSLVSSLVEATSECEALMKLLGEDCDSSSNELGEAAGHGSTEEDQRDPQLQEEAADRSEAVVSRESSSDEIDSRREDGIMGEINAFASDLEALSSLMIPRDDHQDELSDVSDDDSFMEEEGEGSSSSERQNDQGTTTISCNGTKATMKQGAAHAPTSRPAQEAIPLQSRPPAPPKAGRTHHGSLNHLIRLRARKKLSTRESSFKPRANVGVGSTSEADWNEFQRKSFARHISRQQHARLRIMEDQAAEKRLVAARFQHSTTLSRSQQVKSVKQERGSKQPTSVPNADDRSYLDRFFHRQEPRSDIDRHDVLDKDAMTRVLCGVYIYGHRRECVVYMTFSSMAQLRDRVASRLGVNPIVNLYRERGLTTTSTTSTHPRGKGKKQLHPTRMLQRISGFSHIADGDVLCVTRDSYEDMAILCEWMTERRQRPPIAGASPSRSIRSTKTPSSDDQCNQTPTNAVPALRRMVEGDAARRNKPKTCISPLWDCNGRSIRVGDAAYRIRSAPSNDSTRTKLGPKSIHKPRK